MKPLRTDIRGGEAVQISENETTGEIEISWHSKLCQSAFAVEYYSKEEGLPKKIAEWLDLRGMLCVVDNRLGGKEFLAEMQSNMRMPGARRRTFGINVTPRTEMIPILREYSGTDSSAFHIKRFYRMVDVAIWDALGMIDEELVNAVLAKAGGVRVPAKTSEDIENCRTLELAGITANDAAQLTPMTNW